MQKPLVERERERDRQTDRQIDTEREKRGQPKCFSHPNKQSVPSHTYMYNTNRPLPLSGFCVFIPVILFTDHTHQHSLALSPDNTHTHSCFLLKWLKCFYIVYLSILLTTVHRYTFYCFKLEGVSGRMFASLFWKNVSLPASTQALVQYPSLTRTYIVYHNHTRFPCTHVTHNDRATGTFMRVNGYSLIHIEAMNVELRSLKLQHLSTTGYTQTKRGVTGPRHRTAAGHTWDQDSTVAAKFSATPTHTHPTTRASSQGSRDSPTVQQYPSNSLSLALPALASRPSASRYTLLINLRIVSSASVDSSGIVQFTDAMTSFVDVL